MVKNSNSKLYGVFAKAFHEVVVPLLEEMATKVDVKEIKEQLDGIDKRTDRMEMKLIKIEDHFDRHDAKLDYHEKRITKIDRKKKPTFITSSDLLLQILYGATSLQRMFWTERAGGNRNC